MAQPPAIPRRGPCTTRRSRACPRRTRNTRRGRPGGAVPPAARGIRQAGQSRRLPRTWALYGSRARRYIGPSPCLRSGSRLTGSVGAYAAGAVEITRARAPTFERRPASTGTASACVAYRGARPGRLGITGLGTVAARSRAVSSGAWPVGDGPRLRRAGTGLSHARGEPVQEGRQVCREHGPLEGVLFCAQLLRPLPCRRSSRVVAGRRGRSADELPLRLASHGAWLRSCSGCTPGIITRNDAHKKNRAPRVPRRPVGSCAASTRCTMHPTHGGVPGLLVALQPVDGHQGGSRLFISAPVCAQTQARTRATDLAKARPGRGRHSPAGDDVLSGRAQARGSGVRSGGTTS